MAGHRRVKQVFVSSASLATILVFTFSFLFFSPTFVHARPGDRDPGFGDGGEVTVARDTIPVVLLTDQAGRLLTIALGNTTQGIVTIVQRYSSDGILDTTYSAGIPNLITEVAQMDTSDRLVLAGYNPNAGATIVQRLNPDGTLDASFGQNGRAVVRFTSQPTPQQLIVASALAVQPDGKILVGATVSGRFAVLRLNADGSLDTSFARQGRLTIRALFGSNLLYGILVQPDGRIVLGGWAVAGLAPLTTFGFVRLEANGVLDTTFGDGGRALAPSVNQERSCAISGGAQIMHQPDGKLLAAGALYCFEEGRYRLAVARLNADGSPDMTYGSGGTAIIFTEQSVVNSITLDNVGRLIVAGSIDARPGLLRLTPGGMPDANFGVAGRRTHGLRQDTISGQHRRLVAQPDGRLVTLTSIFRLQTPGTTVNEDLLTRFLGGEAAPATNPPGRFSLLMPENLRRYDGGFAQGSLSFYWTLSDEADQYTIEVYKLSGNVRVGQVFTAIVNGETSFLDLTGAQLAPFTAGTYLWTVTASNSQGSVQSDGNVFGIHTAFDTLNIIANGSFERDKLDWQRIGPGTGDRVVCDTPGRRVGDAGACAYRVTGNPGENSRLRQGVNFGFFSGPGDQLTLSAALRNVSARANAPVVFLIVRYSEGGVDRVRLRLPAAGDSYARLSETLTLTGTLVSVVVEVRDRDTNGVFFVDNVQVVPTPDLDVLPSAADGTLPLPAAPDDSTLRGAD